MDAGTIAHEILLEGSQNCVTVIDPADHPAEKTGTTPSGWTNKSLGASCTDGQFCTTNDACNVLGSCVGTPIDCNDGLLCTLDQCDEAADKCTNDLTIGCAISPAR